MLQSLLFYSAFFSLTAGPRRAVCTLLHTSVYSRVPRKTTAVPTQCQSVKGFWKYIMEKMRLRNLRSVTTRVTVSEVHSVVRMKTPRMQTYLKKLVKVANKTEKTELQYNNFFVSDIFAGLLISSHCSAGVFSLQTDLLFSNK